MLFEAIMRSLFTGINGYLIGYSWESRQTFLSRIFSGRKKTLPFINDLVLISSPLSPNEWTKLYELTEF